VLAFHLVLGAAGWRAAGADFGKVPTKQQTILGDKLHLLVTPDGVIRDFALAPASASDVAVGAGVLRGHADLTVLGDKAYISAPLAAALQAERAVALLTVPRRNQRGQLPDATARRLNAARRIIETVNEQLTAQFGIAAHHAYTFRGRCVRPHTKLAAHTLCLYLNRLLGRTDWFQIKVLAFPNEHKGPGVSSVEEDDGGGEVDAREEVAPGLVVARGAGAEVLQRAEAKPKRRWNLHGFQRWAWSPHRRFGVVLDRVACRVQVAVVLALHFAVALGPDDRDPTRLTHRPAPRASQALSTTCAA